VAPQRQARPPAIRQQRPSVQRPTTAQRPAAPPRRQERSERRRGS
jgi:hypothetical protein